LNYIFLPIVFKFIVMNIDFKEIFSATMVLFAVIDIVGNIPIIIELRKKSRAYTI
jgi:multiple antibiotic resistance protein